MRLSGTILMIEIFQGLWFVVCWCCCRLKCTYKTSWWGSFCGLVTVFLFKDRDCSINMFHCFKWSYLQQHTRVSKWMFVAVDSLGLPVQMSTAEALFNLPEGSQARRRPCNAVCKCSWRPASPLPSYGLENVPNWRSTSVTLLARRGMLSDGLLHTN